MYSPELQQLFPSIVQVFSDQNLKSMEHRHVVQLLKQFVEPLLLSTPFTLYTTYLTPLLGPILSHMRWRLDASWRVQGNKVGSSAPSR